MPYQKASKEDLQALAARMLEPIIAGIRAEHQHLVAQQRQFAVALKEIQARQDVLAAKQKDLDQRHSERMSLILMRMGELENQ